MQFKKQAKKVGDAVRSAADSVADACDSKHVRLAANAGLYVIGCVTMFKATTVTAVVVGAALTVVSSVGLGASVSEYIRDSYAKPTTK